jgi:hypothetical protein
MARAGRSDGRFQVNVPLGDEHWHVALQQLSTRDGKSVPDLLRPVIVNFLKRKLAGDPKLAAAVEYLEQSRADARNRRQGNRNLAEVRKISTRASGTRAGSSQKLQPKNGST